MKLNFSMLKNENIGFKYTKDNKTYSFCDKLINVKQNKTNYEFIYENNKMVIEHSNFMHLIFIEENNKYYFVLKDTSTINSLIGFTMFDTYGFPIELTKEIFEEKEKELDLDGFEILRKLSKKKTQENSKKFSAF